MLATACFCSLHRQTLHLGYCPGCGIITTSQGLTHCLLIQGSSVWSGATNFGWHSFDAHVQIHDNSTLLFRLPVVNFAAGGVATPADAALMMQMGVDGVFVGSGVFKSGDPTARAKAIVQAVTHFQDPAVLAEVSAGLGEAMVGIDCRDTSFKSYAARSE